MSHFYVRPFGSQDLAQVVMLWNRCLPKDPISEARFFRIFLLDPNFDPKGMLVAEAEGEIIGFLQAICRKVPLGSLGVQPEQGWVTVFFTCPLWRRRGVATQMLAMGLDFLREQGRRNVGCNGYAPYYVFPGVDQDYREAHSFLEARGFSVSGEPVAMGMSLEGFQTPQSVQERLESLSGEGFAVRSVEFTDALPLLEFSERRFPYWTPSLRDDLVRKPSEITLALHHDEIIGFAQWQNTHTDPPNGAMGRFGPFGIAPEYRNRGIGTLLFYSVLQRITQEGARYLWFGWAGGRNLSFYERAGCIITRRFRQYRHEIGAS